MNRLGKKCVIASIATHGLLLTILLAGPAFFSPHDKLEDMPLLDVLPSKLIDAMASGGGSPTAKPPTPAPAPAPRPPEVVKQPVVEPIHREPVREVKPVKEKAEVTEKAAPTPTKHKVEISTQLVKRKAASTPKKPTSDKTADNEKTVREERLAINKMLNNLKDGLSPSTTVDLPHGSGGEAYANYAQAVKSIYEQAWIAPDEVVDDNGTTKASITIQRDGTVFSAHVIRSSGNATVDRSVERVLERVKFIAPFPEGTTDPQRTFTISFNLKAKRLSG